LESNTKKKTVEEVEKIVVEYSLMWKQLKCVTTGGAGTCVVVVVVVRQDMLSNSAA
jgi:hypothetical protein